jgi:hypothetical protein
MTLTFADPASVLPVAREPLTLTVWPNPAAAGTALNLADLPATIRDLSVFDASGRKVRGLESPGSGVLRRRRPSDRP